MTTLLRFALAFVLFSCSIADAFAQSRDRIGIALGGGGARGIAHVGVLRWLEEHHVPIDAVAGTSMGGLIGGAYAAGMSPDEIEQLLIDVDWDAMFGASDFDFSNLRRKRDLRSYPSRLEFGLKKGIAPPPSFNNGQQVDLLLSRIAAGYQGLATFDDLPTPFRCVAVDLTRAQPVVLRDGSLARAMRATMSTPMVFPPVQMNDAVLVDGGAMDNLPVDVARGMGVQKVIAINVSDLGRKTVLDYSMFGLVAETMDAMIRQHMAAALASADVAISMPLPGYQPLDWRRAGELIKEGYAAAEAAKDKLLPLAIEQAAWDRWRDARGAARRRTLPSPAFVRVEGAGASDVSRMQRRLAVHQGHALDLDALDASINELGGLDRYEALTWELQSENGDYGLVFAAHPKAYGPPFVFLGVNLENTTSNEFRFGLGARYLSFDTFGSGGELRADVSVGSDPTVGASWYRPFASSLFIEPSAMLREHTMSIVHEGRIDAAYRRWQAGFGGDVGLNIGRLTEARVGIRQGWTNASIREGDPGLPEIDGAETIAYAMWTYDGQDDPIVPSRGWHLAGTLTRYIDGPDVPETFITDRSSDALTQAEAAWSWMRSSSNGRRQRIFFSGGAGTSFDGRPLPTEQFAIGGPLRMSAANVGELRGDHYGFAALGYLHQIMRLPSFLGGPVFAGGWAETGSAFDDFRDAAVAGHFSIGIVADTLIGPAFAGASVADDGNSRYFLGIGRIFR